MRLLQIVAASVILLIAYPQIAAAEQWTVRTDFWGVPAYYTLTFERNDNRISGDIDGESVSGTLEGSSIAFEAITNGQPTLFEGNIDNNRMAGMAHYPGQAGDKKKTESHEFTARRVPDRKTPKRQTYTYTPENYSNTFDADRTPVLTIWPGDKVKTKTIDSGGVDERGERKALFGNPQTGPFFIAGAEAGDTLVIHLEALTLNRDYADSLNSMVRRIVGASLVEETNELGRNRRWILDHEAGVARPENATGAMANFSVPLRPMLGGLGVAPGFGWPAISAGDTGSFGGNMDFPEVVEGNTIYLPVKRPGALLYLGDGHALQGDGETTQYALETSLDVKFVVDLIKGNSIGAPRVESPDQVMVLGQAGTMEDALKIASTGMVQLLREDYGLSLSDAAQVLGTSIKYSIVNLAGRNVGIAAKLNKSVLPPSQGVLSISIDNGLER